MKNILLAPLTTLMLTDCCNMSSHTTCLVFSTKDHDPLYLFAWWVKTMVGRGARYLDTM